MPTYFSAGRGALTESGTGFRFASGAGTQVHPHTGAEHQLHAAQAALQMQKGILTEQQARLSDQQKQLRELNADLGIVTRQRDAEVGPACWPVQLVVYEPWRMGYE